MSNLDFAALLCSRLCHDLVSPVGAINNGLEILAEEKDQDMRAAVLDLIEKSTQQTANKLQFFRLAFGAAGGFSAQLDMREAYKATAALLDGSRVELDWQVSVSSANKSVVKLLLNICLIMSESLIRGGTMTVKLEDTDGTYTLEVVADGNKIILQDTIKETLEGKLTPDELEPRTAPAYLAAAVMTELGGVLSVENTGDGPLVIKAQKVALG